MQVRSATLSKRIAQIMTERVRHGAWSALEKLPSEQELCAEFGVSRVTIRQAIKILESRGLVLAKQGKGTFVLRSGAMVHAGLQELKSITDTIEEMGLTPSMVYLDKKIRPATAEEAARFELPDGSSVIGLRRKVLADDAIAAYVEDVMPLWVFGPSFSPANLTGSVFAYLAEHTGVRPRKAIAEVHARSSLSDDWGPEVDAEPNHLYLLLDQLQFDDDNRPFMHTRAYFVEGAFSFVVLRVAD